MFATANPNDVFLFRRTDSTTSITELDRRHYDLRELKLEEFVEQFLEDAVTLQQGAREIFDFDDLIISRLRSFHTSIYPLYETLINKNFDEADDFHDVLTNWAKENDYPYEYPGVQETFTIAAKQHAYLLMNRIVF